MTHLDAPRRFDAQRDGATILFGAGRFAELGERPGAAGAERVLVVTTPGRRALGERALALLGERGFGLFADARAHVPRATVEAARAQVASVDAVLTIGGGSATGLGKALALEGELRLLAAVPTTYAGSEMTPIWGLTGEDGKETGRHPAVRPGFVLYDPELTLDLPVPVSVASALNALAHAVEALWAPEDDPLLAEVAEQATRALLAALPRLPAAPRDLALRSELLFGAHLAGVALAGASMGLHHKLAHVLGGGWDLPHASTHAALLPHVVAYDAPHAPRALRVLSSALRSDDPAGALFDLAAAIGAPTRLEGPFDPEVAAERVTQKAYPNPAPLEVPRIRALLEAARDGRRPGAAPSALPSLYRPGVALETLPGFRATHESEALPGALPRGQNSPREAPFGLHPEQINGVGFTVRRADNLRTWVYRIRPSVLQSDFAPYEGNPRFTGLFDEAVATPELCRWAAPPLPEGATDFLDGLVTLAGNGDPTLRSGLAIHVYAANASMEDRVFYDADGDLLVVPERGRLRVRTELGLLDVAPGQIFVLPRGLRASFGLPDGEARGYVLESFGGPFDLPERGPVGANGYADARHFEHPVAAFEDRQAPFELVAKLGGRLHVARLEHSPFDVVAWHGNLAPFRYDLRHFNAMGSVTFDHPDPSIFTVLTVPFDALGNNLADFVVFPPRWDVAEHTFRPPYFHRNAATEFNGIVSMPAPGRGFEPGGYFLTPTLTAHGVASSAVRRALGGDDTPQRLPDDSLWVMFETILTLKVLPWALEADTRDRAFRDLFADMPVPFHD